MVVPFGLCTAALLFLCGACARAAPAVTSPAPALLAVITWNMDAGSGDLTQLVDDLASGKLTGVPARDYVVLVQEAHEGDDRGVQAIAGTKMLSLHFSAVRRGRTRTSGNAILSTLPLDNRRALDLPRERQPRAAAAADVTVEGQRLFVVSTHLENRLGWIRGLFGDRARGRQAAALLRELPDEGPGIVGGDMNTMLGPTEPAWRTLLGRFPDTPPEPSPTFRDRLVLDHLFFDLPDGWSATRQVLPDRYGSDHHPVLGLVRRTGAGG